MGSFPPVLLVSVKNKHSINNSIDFYRLMIGTSHTEAVETAVKTSSRRSKKSTYMSAYDKKVEERLQKLESSSSTGSNEGGLEERLSRLESRIDNLLTILKMDKQLNIEKLSAKYPVD